VNHKIQGQPSKTRSPAQWLLKQCMCLCVRISVMYENCSLITNFYQTAKRHTSLVTKTSKLNTHTNVTVLRPFFRDYSGEPVPEESSTELHGAREDNRGRDTDHPNGRHSIRTNQQPNSSSSHFYAGCLS